MATHTKPKSRTYSKLAETYGWLGTLLILGSYALLSLGIINSNDPLYHLLVIVGSSGLALITYRHKSYQPFIVNIIFLALGFVGLIRTLSFT